MYFERILKLLNSHIIDSLILVWIHCHDKHKLFCVLYCVYYSTVCAADPHFPTQSTDCWPTYANISWNSSPAPVALTVKVTPLLFPLAPPHRNLQPKSSATPSANPWAASPSANRHILFSLSKRSGHRSSRILCKCRHSRDIFHRCVCVCC